MSHHILREFIELQTLRQLKQLHLAQAPLPAPLEQWSQVEGSSCLIQMVTLDQSGQYLVLGHVWLGAAPLVGVEVELEQID